MEPIGQLDSASPLSLEGVAAREAEKEAHIMGCSSHKHNTLILFTPWRDHGPAAASWIILDYHIQIEISSTYSKVQQAKAAPVQRVGPAWKEGNIASNESLSKLDRAAAINKESFIQVKSGVLDGGLRMRTWFWAPAATTKCISLLFFKIDFSSYLLDLNAWKVMVSSWCWEKKERSNKFFNLY